MKRLIFFGLIAGLGACDMPLPEATCKCFDGAGNSTGNCQFEAVAGAPATAFAPTRSTSNPAEISLSTKGAEPC